MSPIIGTSGEPQPDGTFSLVLAHEDGTSEQVTATGVTLAQVKAAARNPEAARQIFNIQ